MDEGQQNSNLELFVAINYGLKRKNFTEDQIIHRVKDSLCDGADIDAVNLNNAGNTVLHVAIQRHYNDVIVFLLKNGAKVDIENNQGLTALTLAIKLDCEKYIIDLLENCANSITSKLSITYWPENRNIWNKMRNNPYISVLQIDSCDLSPDFLHQLEFYDAIDTAGNLFFVDVMLNHTQRIDEDFIKSQLNRLNKQLIIQCGSLLTTKVYYKDSEGDVNSINFDSPVENCDGKILTNKVSSEAGFGLHLLVEAMMLNLAGKFETEQRSLLEFSFNLELHFGGWKLIDYAVKNGDLMTLRLLSLSNWNLSKLNPREESTLSIAAQHGDRDKLGAVLRVTFPIRLDKSISIPEETAAHFDKCKRQMLETAVGAGNCDVISFMIRCGVQLDGNGIELSWDNKRYDVVLIMLRADCVFPYDFDLNEIDENDSSYIELRKFVDERDELHRLIDEGELERVKEFVKLIAPSKLYLNEDNKSALYMALKSKKSTIFLWLKNELKAEFRDANERKSLGAGVLDSASDALLQHFVPIDNAHVLHLVAKSRCRQHYAGFKDHIEAIYTELSSIPQISTVLKVIQFCDQVDIIYDFDKDSIVDVNMSASDSEKGFCEYKVGRIYIGAKVKGRELLGTIAHELTHLAIETIYKNDCKPYKLDDPIKNNFDAIIKEIEKQSIPVDSIIGRVFSCYGGVYWPSELIVRVNHMLAKYGLEEGLGQLEVQAKSLLNYYLDYVTPCCEKFVKESHLIKPRNSVKVLNDYAGIMRRVDESKIAFKELINLAELCDNNLQITVVTTSSPIISTMRVYQSLKEISQQQNSFLIFNFEGYVKQRIEINQALYSDVCNFLVLLCESDPEESSLSESLNGLAHVLWKKSNKKVIFIMENGDLLQQKVNQLHNISLVVYPDIEYSLDDVCVESAALFLDQNVSLQCRDARVKLSSLIHGEHFKLVDAQTLLKLINKQPIVIGKQITTSSQYDRQFYIDRSFCHQAVIKEDFLKDEDPFTMYAISNIEKAALVNIVKSSDSVSTYDCLNDDSVVKYVIVDSINGSQQYLQLCEIFPWHNIHQLKKVNGGLYWLSTRSVDGDMKRLLEFVNEQLVSSYTEDSFVNDVDIHCGCVVSDTAGMGKTTILTSLALRLTKKCPHLWVIRVDLNDYSKILDQEQMNKSFEKDQPSGALTFLVDTLLGSRVESRLETEFERNLLLHFLQHSEDRVVIMFDGFDEIKYSHQVLIKDVLVALKSSKVKQLWVTTRPHMRETLENTLHQLAYTLQPFHEVEQVNFLIRFWCYKLKLGVESDVTSDYHLNSATEKLLSFAEALIELLSKSIGDREKEFTGVPLQLRMVAECFEKEVKLIVTQGKCQVLPQKLQLNNLYQMFFDEKFKDFQSVKNEIDFSKCGVESQSNVVREHFLNNYQIASLFAIFDDKEREMLLTDNELKDGASFIKEIAKNEWNVGIIDLIIDGRPRFVHLTFAEYFTSEFIVNQPTTEQNELLFADILYEDKFKVVRAFIDSKLGDKSGLKAVWNMNRSVMRSVMSRMYRFDNVNIPFADDEKTFLHVAAEEGNVNLVNILLICLDSNRDIRAKLMECVYGYGMQALHFAVANGHLHVVKALVEHKVDVNARICHYKTILNTFDALLLSAYKGHTGVCEWLITNGADINVTVIGTGDYNGLNVLHVAALGGRIDVVKMLKNVKGIDFKLLVKGREPLDGMNALHMAAFKGHWNVVEWIISEGLIDVNLTTSPLSFGEQTVLTMVVDKGPPELVQMLIQHNADVNTGQDAVKNTALHIASRRDRLDVLEMLLSKGANMNAVNRLRETPLHVGFIWGSEQLVESLLKCKDIDVNIVDEEDETPLHLAVLKNKLKEVKTILSKGANLNAVNCEGETPLHKGLIWGSEQLVDILLRIKEVDVNIADNEGETPLHIATRMNKLKVVRMLVSKGANVNAANSIGETPLHLATQLEYQELVDFLLTTEDIDVN